MMSENNIFFITSYPTYLPQILSYICLPERRNPSWIEPSGLRRRSGRNPKSLKFISALNIPSLSIPWRSVTGWAAAVPTYQRRIIHRINHHPLMLRTVLTPSSHMRFHHIAPVQIRHLSIRFDPHLVPRMRRNDIQRRDVQSKFPRLGEFS